MTDRHAGYLVTLAADIRKDDAEAVVNAISMVKGVLSVTPVPSDVLLHIAQERRDSDWRDALWRLAKEGPG